MFGKHTENFNRTVSYFEIKSWKLSNLVISIEDIEIMKNNKWKMKNEKWKWKIKMKNEKLNWLKIN